jgi:hypothetical protein
VFNWGGFSYEAVGGSQQTSPATACQAPPAASLPRRRFAQAAWPGTRLLAGLPWELAASPGPLSPWCHHSVKKFVPLCSYPCSPCVPLDSGGNSGPRAWRCLRRIKDLWGGSKFGIAEGPRSEHEASPMSVAGVPMVSRPPCKSRYPLSLLCGSPGSGDMTALRVPSTGPWWPIRITSTCDSLRYLLPCPTVTTSTWCDWRSDHKPGSILSLSALNTVGVPMCGL